jgi:tRNA pseudouridine38-40 synthase
MGLSKKPTMKITESNSDPANQKKKGEAKRYFIEFAFRGTEFHGWQVQPNAVTVQEVMEQAMSDILRTAISLTGAGRTDTGVHARYFVAHFDCKTSFNPDKLSFKLNGYLNKDITILRILEAPPEAHVRFDAISRTYKYLVLRKKHSFLHPYALLLQNDLDMERMNEASGIIKQTKDFSSFAKLHSDNKTNICSISQAYWEEKEDYLVFTITADRFLRNMVRSITGTLLDVGKKKISLDEFRDIIESHDNQKASASATAQGLFLWNIEYPARYRLVNHGKENFLPFL